MGDSDNQMANGPKMWGLLIRAQIPRGGLGGDTDPVEYGKCGISNEDSVQTVGDGN